MKKYDHKKIEKKIQKKWEEQKIYNRDIVGDLSKPKYYVLDMFPYPSGDGLHMGHTESYTASDIIYRYKRLKGFDVLHPQGFDSFGLPAENYAIKTGVHPKETTKTNASNYIQQMKMLGLGHDLNHLVYTSNSSYYRWTQWLFGKFFENDLVEQKTDKINWCPSCNTGIANEQVENGKCERCKADIEQREIPGWFFKITDFAEDLINDLDKVDWPEHTKKNQRNWIGKSVGAKINFKLKILNSNSNSNKKISNVILMHGKNTNLREKWYPWLAEKMKKNNIKFTAPKLPNADDPEINEWMSELEKVKSNQNSVLIGHSRGGVAILRWLEKQPEDFKIKKVILVATNSGDSIKRNKTENNKGFFTKEGYDFEKIKKHCDDFVVLHSEDDEWVPFEAGEENSKGLNAKFLQFKNRGHFGSKLPKQEIPELLEEILNSCQSASSASSPRSSATSIEVFTTRPDTLFGATYLVVAPEHEIIVNDKLSIINYKEVKKYVEEAKNKTEMDRLEAKTKTGVKLKGLTAINPANGEEIPIFVADYVLGGYGTGAIMAVPAHDERDYEFATHYNESRTNADDTQTNADRIEIRQVIAPKFIGEGKNAIRKDKPMTERNIVDVIIKHWKKDEYFCLDWNKSGNNWHSFIVGGVESGETLEEAALRETREETGYKNMKVVKQVGGEMHSYFYAAHKGVNRAPVKRNCIYIELLDGEWESPAEEHVKNHDGVWVKKSEVEQRLNLPELKMYWRIFTRKDEGIFTDKGVLINSGKFDGMDSEKAKKAITEFVGGEMTTNYRLRDWSISRQRYWGCPIPIVYSPEGEAKFVGEENLPWLLPEDVDFQPTGTAPLAKSKELKERTEKLFGKGWTPEVDTMDTFVDSSWYFLRYPDTENEKEFCSPEKLKRWLPVDLYIGGAEHTYMHLLFARFFVKAMNKMGLIEFNEPFKKLRHQGMVLDKDGVKMSKSKGNVVNPNDMVERFGADATRMYMMFAAPLEDEIAFKQEGVKGVFRFLEKVFSLYEGAQANKGTVDAVNKKQIEFVICNGDCKDIPKELPVLLHKTIKGVTEDIEELKFNTAISKLMIFINECNKYDKLPKSAMEKFLILLSPFAPHLTEELWHSLRESLIDADTASRSQANADSMQTDTEGVRNDVDSRAIIDVANSGESIFNQQWPKYNPKMIVEDKIEMVVQINGKVRDKIQVPADISEDEAKEKALASEKIKKYTDDQEIKKAIFIKGRLLNLVVK